VTERHHTAARTGRLQLARLHGQNQPLQVVDFDVEDVHANNIEDHISPGTPDPVSSLLDQHADPRSAIKPMLRSEEPFIVEATLRASVLLRWPPSPTVCSSHPKALASLASALSAARELELQVLATAQATLVRIRAEHL
jgi:hypothetical protein